uniref:MoaB/Mog domain-containing protein n=1 Tax=Ciona intestinalis TaxID=7719 RepID=H2XXW3_CIOIN
MSLSQVLSDKKSPAIFVGVLTIDDKCYNAQKKDVTGPKIQSILTEIKGFRVIIRTEKIVRDDIDEIKNTLCVWSDKLALDMIITVGGISLKANSVTPEATQAVVQREATGLQTAMVMRCLRDDPRSMVFRGIAGIRNKTLIINLPGYLQTAVACIEAISTSLPVVLGQLKDKEQVFKETITRKSSLKDDLINFNLPFTPQAPAITLQVGTKITSSSNQPRSTNGSQTLDSSSVSSAISTNHSQIPTSLSSGLLSTDSQILEENHAPVDIHHAPVDIHHAPVDIHHAPVDIHHAPVDIHHTPVDMHHTPVDMHHTPVDIHHAPVDIHHAPVDIHHAPVDIHHAPVDMHHTEFDINQEQDAHHVSENIHHASSLNSNSDTHYDAQSEDNRSSNLISKNDLLQINQVQVVSSFAENPFQENFSDSGVSAKTARRARVYPYPPVSLEKAFGLVLYHTVPTSITTTKVKDALYYTLAEDVTSKQSIPVLPTSILDGYAVIAFDVPGDLEVINNKQFGNSPVYVSAGKCLRVNTGDTMPPGSNACVKVEDTTVLQEAEDGDCELAIRVNELVKVGESVRDPGCDLQKGDLIYSAGTKLNQISIGVLAAAGVSNVPVYKLPVVAVFSIGNKLVDQNKENVRLDEIRDTNRPTLLMLLRNQGYPTIDYGILPSNRAQVKEMLTLAYQNADAVISTGGCSLGDKDIVKSVIQEIGGTLHFGRVNIKPGAPAAFGTLKTAASKKLFFCLPGVPVPALTAYYLLVKPCLQKLSGFKTYERKIIRSGVSSDINLGPTPECQRATVRYEKNEVVPFSDVTGNQSIHRLQSMAAANLLLLLPGKTSDLSVIKKGQIVDSLVIDEI